MSENKDMTVREPSLSERFMTKVVSEFGSGVGDVKFTAAQKRMAQNYFITLDAALQAAETKRYAKKNNLPFAWQNVNMNLLARDVVSAVRVGLDSQESNHVHLIPYKNNKTNKYDIGFIPGYRGIELKAKKYGLDIPDSVVVEIVYQNDKFTMHKKDRANPADSYCFQIENPFDRGEVVGGFYFHEYKGRPEKNKLVVMTIKDILKRKPKYASAEFWGGEKDEWDNGRKTGNKTQVEGWFDEMVWKTIYRAAYNDITIDSTKIDEDYQNLKDTLNRASDLAIEADYSENANQEVIDIDTSGHDEAPPFDATPENVDQETGEVTAPKEAEEPADTPAPQDEPQQQDLPSFAQ